MFWATGSGLPTRLGLTGRCSWYRGVRASGDARAPAAQVEVGQLDELTGLSSKALGILTLWLIQGNPCSCLCACHAAQVEVGQVDELTGLSSKSVGNLTYWLLGSVLHATLDLRDGALSKPLSLYAATTPPTGPPPLLDAEVHAPSSCCVHSRRALRGRVGGYDAAHGPANAAGRGGSCFAALLCADRVCNQG